MNNSKYRWNLNKQFLALTVLPVIGLGLIIMSVASSRFSQTLLEHVHEELKNVSSAVLVHFDLAYPGDYTLQKNVSEDGLVSYDLLKGDAVITKEYEYIDYIKETTGIDITIFYSDTRILTTLFSSSGNRHIGSAAHPTILDDVLYSGESHFYKRILVNSIPYFAHYEPIFNSNGETVGMIFAGKPSEFVEGVISEAVLPIFFVSIIACVCVGLLSLSTSRKIVFSIKRINTFLSQIAQGDLNTNIDSRVLMRMDELGDIGRASVNMQRSLRTLIECDALTGLSNRRYADKRLQQLISSNHIDSGSFTIALGDIDYFKKVNDTYGHSAGDVILKGVAELIQKHMRGVGYAARWGGEEFLFVFEKTSYKESVKRLSTFLEELRNTSFTYKDIEIKVTMTIGVAVCHPTDKLNILVKYADDKLYKGKSEGRNQIVT